MNSQSNLAKFESRFAQARSCYERQNTKNTKPMFCKGHFLLPLSSEIGAHILSNFRELKATLVCLEFTPVKTESEGEGISE